ncbi:MAG: hypothetical protein GC155_01385 [Alphaproteobacteria bacterium]|nr:hypothetical protein [Alphaproteobacteria bacterium]
MAAYVPFRTTAETEVAPARRKSSPFAMLQFAGSVALFAGLTGAATSLLDVYDQHGQMITVLMWMLIAGTGGIVAAVGAVGSRLLRELTKPL